MELESWCKLHSGAIKHIMLLGISVLLCIARHSLALPRLTAYDSATLNGVTYVNKGIVAFGLIPSNATDATGDTMGGFGSAIALKRGTFRRNNDTFSGTLLARPDRGFNVDGPIDYQARQYEIDFLLTPYYGSENLSFEDAQKTLELSYKKIIMQYDRLHKKTSGSDPTAVRKSQPQSQQNSFLDPALPIVSKEDNRIVIDVEGLVANDDGSFWVSDEYGPYIYKFSANGQLIETIQPPDAFLPRDTAGSLNFTSITDPITGRSANQGFPLTYFVFACFEGLTLDADSGLLYTMLQSATVQDGGGDKKTS
ncbi:hypothetical protein D9613_012031 [Agrocybe pediades]|uniref:Phytase-like domain-containing protein n=1 Tax=Agrocybe pediades TaxID=84607 RepID=A0A8H4QES3_9AGAR|nr:hypothetical protein D9613_012031 [Agrocybe pediades]